MANHLDLEEQEQLEQLKHFWNQYGNLITWILIAVLAAIAAWNGYQYWQRNQAAQAAAMFDEVERVTRSADPEKTERAFNDMKDRFASTLYTQQAGLLVAKSLSDAGKADQARNVLSWVAEHAADPAYASLARLRLSSLLLESKSYAEALRVLEAATAPGFQALVADRRGDIYLTQGMKAQAKEEFVKAYKTMDERAEYRRLVEVKLNALGIDPAAAAPGEAGK
jgi:predicted negative regulator of RcsB-dependent stress response